MLVGLGPIGAAVGRQLAKDGAGERSNEQPRQPEEQAGEGPDGGRTSSLLGAVGISAPRPRPSPRFFSLMRPPHPDPVIQLT